MMRRIFFLTLMLSAASVSGAAWARTPTLSVSSSLAALFRNLNADYQRQSGRSIYINSSSAALLVRQVLWGADVDFLVVAGEKAVQQMAEHTAIASSSPVLSNTLVIVHSADSAAPASQDIHAALRAAHRIAVADPHIPLGDFSRRALTATKLWDEVQAKLIFCDQAESVTQLVLHGSVDTAIIYQSDLVTHKKLRAGPAIPQALTGPIAYYLVLLKKDRSVSEINSFLRYLQTPAAAAIISAFGFAPGKV